MSKDAAETEATKADATQTDVTEPALRILVIDDESVIGLSCQRTLEAAGHEVQYFPVP